MSVSVEEGGIFRTTTAAAGDVKELRFVGEALAAWMRDGNNVARVKAALK